MLLYLSDPNPNAKEPSKVPTYSMLCEKLISHFFSQTIPYFDCTVSENTLLSQIGSSQGQWCPEELVDALQVNFIGGDRNIKLRTCQNIGSFVRNRKRKKK